jgi:hypothetical protein
MIDGADFQVIGRGGKARKAASAWATKIAAC